MGNHSKVVHLGVKKKEENSNKDGHVQLRVGGSNEEKK
jgi:hypothetical protein